MMNSKPNWRTLLNRWISGEADRNDEQTLRAMAKDDPFLADALEGLASQPEADHARAVSRMKANLRSKYERKQRGVIFYLQRAAAVGVLLIAAWFVLGQFDRDENLNELADHQLKIENSEMASNTESMLTDSMSIAFVDEPDNEAVIKKEDAPPRARATAPEIASKKAETGTSSNAYLPSPKVLNEAPVEYSIVEEFDADEPPVAARPVPPVEDELGYIAKEEKKLEPQPVQENASRFVPSKEAFDADMAIDFEQLIKGKVSDSEGYPLIGASILIDGTELGAVTDLEGNFTLSSPIENPPLTISYTGFQNQNVQAVGPDFLLIQLEENLGSLSEVVVTGLSSRAKRSAPAVPSFEPKGGFKKFEKYIKKNLSKPQPAVDARVNGTVSIGFRLDETGTPIDLKVLQPLGFGCDEEAQRLLLEGPKWNGPANTQTVYNIEF